jgi:hypothetical protein
MFIKAHHCGPCTEPNVSGPHYHTIYLGSILISSHLYLCLPSGFLTILYVQHWPWHFKETSMRMYVHKFFALLKSSIFWDIMLCSSRLKVNQHFGGTCHLHLQDWKRKPSKKLAWSTQQARNVACGNRLYENLSVPIGSFRELGWFQEIELFITTAVRTSVNYLLLLWSNGHCSTGVPVSQLHPTNTACGHTPGTSQSCHQTWAMWEGTVPRVNKINPGTMHVYLCCSLLSWLACTRPGWPHWVREVSLLEDSKMIKLSHALSGSSSKLVHTTPQYKNNTTNSLADI